MEVVMPVSLKRPESEAAKTEAASTRPVLVQLFWFAAAGLFVSVLCLTYGLDLSPGLF
jgi:hypothetical protein